MSDIDIRKAVQEELSNIAPEIDIASVDPTADLREALDIDFMDFLNFVTAIHHRLNVDVPELDYPKLITIDGAVRYLEGELLIRQELKASLEIFEGCESFARQSDITGERQYGCKGTRHAVCRSDPAPNVRDAHRSAVVPHRAGIGAPSVTEADLLHFVNAQAGTHSQIVEGLTAGRKRTHWMWFIFPQLAGLGHSAMAQRYAIWDIDQARRYLADPILGNRLRLRRSLILRHKGKSAPEILGSPR